MKITGLVWYWDDSTPSDYIQKHLTIYIHNDDGSGYKYNALVRPVVESYQTHQIQIYLINTGL